MAKARAVVLAAGQGTRMKSDLPKVLVPVRGRPMIDYVLDMLEQCAVEQTIVVVGYRSELVREHLAGRKNIAFAEQHERLGTGHAVMMCRDALAGFDGATAVVCGDSPLVRADSINSLLRERERGDAAGRFVGIVEEKDATPEQRKITEVNMSCYVFRNADLLGSLDKLRADNAQREYYITDCPGILRAAGRPVEALAVLTPQETLSINTAEELAVVEQAMAHSPNS